MPTIKKGIICEDENLQNKIYPYTQMDCVFDSDNSTTLDVVVDDIKENLMYVDEIGAYENVVPINADLLEGTAKANLPLNVDLLWRNPIARGNFAAQTVSIPTLQEYQFVMITYTPSTLSSSPLGSITAICRLTLSAKIIAQFASYRTYFRIATINSTGIAFEVGKYYATYGTNTATDAEGSLIPYEIYGVKANITDKTGA